MTNFNQYPAALEGDELGQRVYASLRFFSVPNSSPDTLSEGSLRRLRQANAYLATRGGASEVTQQDTQPTEAYLGKVAIEELDLPDYTPEEVGPIANFLVQPR